MVRDTDALTSATLKHLRERWWNSDFTDFLRETLQPRAGNRILDVGCGVGTAELTLGRLRMTQVELVAVDFIHDYVRQAAQAAQAHNIKATFACGDAQRLPFRDQSFHSTYCVAVLQHVRDLASTVEEFARVTKPGGRVLAVEPDNGARYWYSSLEIGSRTFELGTRFFTALAGARGDTTDLAVGPKLSAVFAQHGIEPTAVRLFPVTRTSLGAPPPALWESRKDAVRIAIEKAPDEALRRLGTDYLKLLDKYAAEAAQAGPAFVEIQNTMLFATVGQKQGE
jgi:SAM-dependent methyltransferase